MYKVSCLCVLRVYCIIEIASTELKEFGSIALRGKENEIGFFNYANL